VSCTHKILNIAIGKGEIGDNATEMIRNEVEIGIRCSVCNLEIHKDNGINEQCNIGEIIEILVKD